MQHSVAYLLEESRRAEQARRMAQQRALREAATAAGTLPKEQPRKRRMAARGGETGGIPATMQAVLDFLSDGVEHTIEEGALATSMKQTSFASRMRHLRLERNGAHTIQCRVGDIITEHSRVRFYRLVS